MVENYIDVRHIQKHETEANWLTLAPNFIPKRGEIIVYDVDENYNYERMKIGDGLTLLKDLPFTNKIDVATGLEEIEVGTGLKVSEKADNKQTIAFDEEVVFFINCN